MKTRVARALTLLCWWAFAAPSAAVETERECRTLFSSAPFVRPLPFVREAAGSSWQAIEPVIQLFQLDLDLTRSRRGGPGSFGTGLREIDFTLDGLEQFAAPNSLPADFYRNEGVLLATPGTGFQISAEPSGATGTPPRFGNLNPTYPANFQAAFQRSRLLAPLDSTVTEVTFVVPGSTVPAQVKGFGVVLTDVERDTSAKLEFFGAQGDLFCASFVPPSGHAGFSFLGVSFQSGDGVAKVRITSGTHAPGPDDAPPDVDIAVMAAFIYGEPVGKAILTISPPTGLYLTTQVVDVALIVVGEDVAVIGGRARLTPGPGSLDVTQDLASCIIPGRLALAQGLTFRCPGIRLGGGVGGLLRVFLDLNDGSTIVSVVDWTVRQTTEP